MEKVKPQWRGAEDRASCSWPRSVVPEGAPCSLEAGCSLDPLLPPAHPFHPHSIPGLIQLSCSSQGGSNHPKKSSEAQSFADGKHLENPRDAGHTASPEDSVPSTAGPWDGAGGSCRSLCHGASGGASRQPGSVAASRRDAASGDEPSPVQTVWRRSRLGCSRCCLRSRCPTAELGRRCLDMC